MRSIKFRGKGIHDGRWYYGDLIHDECLTSINFITDDPRVKSIEMVVIPETVGQFIGLTDKNGIEIYEGDIFRRLLNKRKKFDFPDDFSDYWLVEWLDKTAGFTTTRIGDLCGGVYRKKDPSRNSFSQRFNEADEIIGNIHDNPELLK